MKKLFNSVTACMVMIGVIATNAVLAKGGDIEAGEQKAAVCAACHGADGNSLVPLFPKLAGQSKKYLIEQTTLIKDKVRLVPEMNGITDSLSAQDIADISAFYAAQKTSMGEAKNDEELLTLGEQVYRAGKIDVGMAACIACHSPRGLGNGPAGYPALGGQHAEYLVKQLRAYRAAGREDEVPNSEKRSTGGDTAIMQNVAKHLSDKEIRALANYLSGLY